MAESFEYAVIGLGALGSATAYHLTKRGHSVVGFERFGLGHVRGASHDTSRILRHSYHTSSYVGLTLAAYDDWAALEVDSGETLVTVTGGLDLFPAGGAIPVADYVDSLGAHDIAHELLSAAEVQQRWPAFRLPDDVTGLYQERAAIVPAGRGTAVLHSRALAHGADLRADSPVTGLRDLGSSGVEVAVGDTTYRCRKVVVCADAWTNPVLKGLGVQLPLDVTLEQVTYFQPAEIRQFEPGHFPLWIWMDEPCYYGFPTYGEPTIKAAQDCGGPIVDPDDRGFAPDEAMLDRLAAHLAWMLPQSGAAVRSVRCQYTLPPDRDFLLDMVPGCPSVVVGLGAGHGFKFAPTIGRLLADLAETGQTGVDLTPYRFDRPGLTDPAFEPNWMV